MNHNHKNISPVLTSREVSEISKRTGNIYETIVMIGKRARQISSSQREELNNKLQEFATTIDNLEEVFENREQIEISKYYERMPKPATLATEEFLAGEVSFRYIEEELDQEVVKQLKAFRAEK